MGLEYGEIRRWWPLFNRNLSFLDGNGHRVKFWKVVWCGETLLCESFPSLFAIDESKEAWVSECWSSP